MLTDSIKITLTNTNNSLLLTTKINHIKLVAVSKNSDQRQLKMLLSVLQMLPLITLLAYVLKLVILMLLVAHKIYKNLLFMLNNLLVILHGLDTTGVLNLPTDNLILLLEKNNRMKESSVLEEMFRVHNSLTLNQYNRVNTVNNRANKVMVNLIVKNYSKLSERKLFLVVLEVFKVWVSCTELLMMMAADLSTLLNSVRFAKTSVSVSLNNKLLNYLNSSIEMVLVKLIMMNSLETLEVK